MLASILQISGVIGLIIGVFLVAGVGFAVLAAGFGAFVVGYQMERRRLPKPAEGR